LTEHEVSDAPADDRVDLTLQFLATNFAQSLPGPVVVVRAPTLPGGSLPALASVARRTPLVLDARDDQDEFAITIPAGLVADELPAARALDAPFGRFRIAWSVRDGRLVRTAILQIARTTVPADEYPAVREFFDAFRAADAEAAVLARP
jgi:hypothetical protein